jgi:hypothetical protein
MSERLNNKIEEMSLEKVFSFFFGMNEMFPTA